MPPRRLPPALGGLALLALSACAAGPEASGPRTAPPGFACPADGVRVTYSSGQVTVWRGADPADPGVCLVDVIPAQGAPRQDRRVLATWNLPQTGIEETRRGFAQLFPLAVGKSASFQRFGLTAQSTPVTYQEDWRVLRREPLTVGDQTRDTWVVERRSEFVGGSFSGELTYWVDAATLVSLKMERGMVRGTWTGQTPYMATAIVVPR
jgi:hypothetical protein